MHVTLRARDGLPSFREHALFQAILPCIRAASRSPDAFRILHFSVQHDHLHFIVEARTRAALSRGVQGLAIRLAKTINKTFTGIHGNVWADRFHARRLTTARDVRGTLVYVLMNAKKHGCTLEDGIDPFSSARWFDGFRCHQPIADGSPVVAGRARLCSTWRALGLIDPSERPKS